VPLHFPLNITLTRRRYFSRYALGIFTKDPRYAKYINAPLLERYFPVGGVRIEDNILITEDGYENLTTAPKGEEALRIINEGDDGDGEWVCC
jgi:Xaa-Pro dipeptidase